MHKTAIRFLAMLVLLSLSRLSIAQNICGEYSTVPGSSVRYMYLPGTGQFEILPVQANFDIACDDFSLSAVLFSPIIGVDEKGNEIFPTGLTYPLVVELDYDPITDYMGSLQGTQYNVHWTFSAGPDATVLWNGTVSWFGGRYEETTIEDVVLTPVPEMSTATMLIATLLLTLPFILRTRF